ncbi:hypothetical protein CDD82_3444 [Ophiocordyceps australis]|uniref:DUF5672 domain-containing protein n=1 Tax=Ophiocordyceps australis TaxID=1399860 RepID=A0A2C5Z6Z0_9HYPO|nr:hypothetical protein CDD82_3444 [Ophiocordyceps australis]
MLVSTPWRPQLSRLYRLLLVALVCAICLAHTPYPLSSIAALASTTLSLHRLSLRQPRSSASTASRARALNASKLALLIENRPLPVLAPLLLHFVAVLPPDWRFLFLGSDASLALLNASAPVRRRLGSGKLTLAPIPLNTSTAGPEMVSRFLTDPWLYRVAAAPARWLLIFQTDSMLCANSRFHVDSFLAYDWVGAPWVPDGHWGGNGGLSLRRVEPILDVLHNQVRANDSEPEDVWLAERLAHRPGANSANGSVALTFSGEMNSGVAETVVANATLDTATLDASPVSYLVHGIDDWRHGFYEPMGYHTGGSGVWLHSAVWGTPQLRRHIWDYCPEVKMTLAMDFARYVPGSCNSRWP